MRGLFNGRTQRSTRIDPFGRKHVTETEIVAGVRGRSRTTTTR